MANYTGAANLELMREAVKYNRFLTDLVLAQSRSGDRIADFGAGSGAFAVRIVAHGHKVICIETDPVFSAQLEKDGFEVYEDLESVSDSSLDYIYSLNVLEHIADDASVIALWHRKLRPGGRLLVYVPAFQTLFSSMDRKVGHYRRYRAATLLPKLRAADFQIVSWRYVDCLGALATLIFKALDNGAGDINVRALKIFDRLVFPASRALDLLVGRIVGKNIYAIAAKTANSAR